jgi:AcrR family transcriptional regulator
VRADARRNREKIVAVAEEAFAEHGAGASLDDIAKRAGVGPGTLYRHFPTREALQEAVYRGAIEELAARGAALAATLPPGPALEGWMTMVVEHMGARRDLATALTASLGKRSEVFVDSHRLMHSTGETLVEAAKGAGAVRADLDHRDLLWMAHGVAQATEGDGGAQRGERLLSVLLAGMRAG